MSKEELASALIGFIVLILWRYFYDISCFSVIFPLIVSFFIFISIYEFNKERRKCKADCYFKENSFFYRWLTRKKITFILSLLASFILTLVLVSNIISFTTADFFIFAGDISILYILYDILKRKNFLKEKVKSAILINTVSWINAIILSVLLFFITLYQTPPQYIRNDLLETVNQAAENYSSLCGFIDTYLFFIETVQAVKWWGILKFSLIDFGYRIKEIIWIIFLINNYLLAFAFGKYILKIKNLSERIANEK